MPELSRFAGMVIYLLFYDVSQHHKPHVHVYYGDYEAAWQSMENCLPGRSRANS